MSAPYLKITYIDHVRHDNDHIRGTPFCNSDIFYQTITNYRKLTSGDDVKDVYECIIDLSDITYDITPGDAIGILPCNNPQEVRLLMDLVCLKNTFYELSILENTTKKKPVIPAHIPKCGYIFNILTRYLDIRSTPKKVFLKMLAEYATKKEEKEALLKLSLPKEEMYYNFLEEDGRSLVGILQKFSSCKPPFERLLEHLPSLKPRFYSISSKTDKSLSITFSVIKLFHKTEVSDENILKGVCSSYLENCILSDTGNQEVCFYFRQSSNFLQFDKEFNSPLILIGPGTGVAPFKGFLDSVKDREKKFDIYLFFGCRYNVRDFLFKEELYEFLKCGVLKNMFLAFSREGKQKVYVQDKIIEEGDLISKLLMGENAHLCLCGDAKNLTKDVDKALVEILHKFVGLDKGEGGDFLEEMKASGRYRIDSWI